jgi:hypothetical protein
MHRSRLFQALVTPDDWANATELRNATLVTVLPGEWNHPAPTTLSA